MGPASFDMAHRRLTNLSIDTNTFHGQTALISPPESANSARRSSYDMSFHHDPLSYHPNTPVHFTGQDIYNVTPSEKLKIVLHQQYPPSPVDFAQGQQHYTTACNSPTWTSSMTFTQKPEVDTSFYQDSSTLLSTDQDWNSSMSHYSQVDYAPDPNSLFMLPSQDPTASFMTDVDSSHHEHLPTFITPSQAVHQPEMIDYSLSVSGWGGLQTPVHDSNTLHSSSPPEFSPVTPTTLEFSFESSYVKNETSPASSFYGSTSRSSLSKKGRKMSKADKRRAICKSVPLSNSAKSSITFLTDEKSEEFFYTGKEGRQNLKNDANSKKHKCKFPTCEQSFARSEHCKRHENSHSKELHFSCYICDHRLDPNEPKSRCSVGKANNGRQNRHDNSRSHHWTHVKAYLVIHDALVRERNKTANKKSKGRNWPISPEQMLKLVRARDTPQQQDVVLKFLNGEAGKDFGVHILWEEDGCPVVPCPETVGAGGCGMCRAKQGKGKK
ncbi:hypothetical protein M436DRAFT_84610 [Aureobasidium namibiae CBS 147.97]|uniref:C2H2-type domain-containing protein n=1 Tax=Aureobasidium namibiae CBS 147.97 TaxID=1043004 RepID=A0A074WL37_9PEZI